MFPAEPCQKMYLYSPVCDAHFTHASSVNGYDVTGGIPTWTRFAPCVNDVQVRELSNVVIEVDPETGATFPPVFASKSAVYVPGRSGDAYPLSEDVTVETGSSSIHQ